MSSKVLHTFGFNAYQQLSPLQQTKVVDAHTSVSRILLVTWESTFILTDQNTVELWGYRNMLLDGLVVKWNAADTVMKCLFGDLKIGLGTLDNNGYAYWWFLLPEQEAPGDGILLATNIKQAGVCQEMNRIYLLSFDEYVIEFDLDELLLGEKPCPKILGMPSVSSMAMSETHVLFAVDGMAPVYGMGSNRMGQLGMDMDLIQQVDQPTILDFFNGLGTMGDSDPSAVKVACGPFHSAVTVHQDLYTFGWNDSGRIGWGLLTEDDDSQDDTGIKLASFIDNGCEVDILVDKVCCGSAHTVVIDVDGSAWTCGSGKYLQLGRTLDNEDNKTHDDYFRRCSGKMNTIVDCQAGPWSTLLLEQQ